MLSWKILGSVPGKLRNGSSKVWKRMNKIKRGVESEMNGVTQWKGILKVVDVSLAKPEIPISESETGLTPRHNRSFINRGS